MVWAKIFRVLRCLPKEMRVVVMARATVGTARNWKSRVYTVARNWHTASTALTCRRPRTVPRTSAPSHQKSCLLRVFMGRW